jgi:hypothetical protein
MRMRNRKGINRDYTWPRVNYDYSESELWSVASPRSRSGCQPLRENSVCAAYDRNHCREMGITNRHKPTTF